MTADAMPPDDVTPDVLGAGEAEADDSSTAPPWRVSEWGIPEWFVIAQTLLPALLFLPGTQIFRLPLRISAFAIGAGIWAYLCVVRQQTPLAPHPSRPWLLFAMVYLALNILHPTTNSWSGALAQIVLYFCIMSPLFWAPELVRTPEQLRRLIILLLVTNGINAFVGVLQVYDPDTWLPDEFSRIITESRYGLAPVSYLGPNGQRIIRPPGLFDTPGAVAGPGMVAALLGGVFAATPARLVFRLASAGFAIAGIMAIYLSQVRVSLVVLAGMLAVYFSVLLVQGRLARATTFGTLLGGLGVAGLSVATILGGTSIVQRFSTLFEEDPFALYYASRGNQLVFAFNDLVFQAPFGSGLGRWGMAANYFSDPTNLDSPSIWAEIQLSGWMIDGGVVLLAAYSLSLVATALYEWRVATRPLDDWVRASGALVLAANLGAAALVFSFTPFVSQVGMQYWFLAGALHGVVVHGRQDRYL